GNHRHGITSMIGPDRAAPQLSASHWGILTEFQSARRVGSVLQTIRFLLCLFAAVICLLAQGGESTEILGLVEDGSGAVVPGVQITATHVATGQARRTVTGDSGVYVFSFMQPGEYTISASKAGFKTEVRSGLELQLNQKARVNFSMQVGAVAESV